MKLFDKIFNKFKASETADLTRITRTEVIEGFSIPSIISNMQYFFTDLQIYSDGLIDCWRMVDLPMFKDELNRNWVVTSIPDGQTISIFSLGFWTIEKGEWIHNKDSFYDYVHSLVKRLNPTLENLHNYNGNDSKMVGKVNVAKHSQPDPKPYYDDNSESLFPKKISGEKFRIFFRHEDKKTYLAKLSIYKSGRIEITDLPVKKVFNFEDIKELINNGQFTTELKVGELVTILGLGSFTVVSGAGININLKYNEFLDKFSELNGRENSLDKCARIFEEYKQKPTTKKRQELKEAYEAIPEHQRRFVGDMDTKDYKVRQVIYGDIVKKEYEDIYGDEYPFDDMPKPIDE